MEVIKEIILVVIGELISNTYKYAIQNVVIIEVTKEMFIDYQIQIWQVFNRRTPRLLANYL